MSQRIEAHYSHYGVMTRSLVYSFIPTPSSPLNIAAIADFCLQKCHSSNNLTYSTQQFALIHLKVTTFPTFGLGARLVARASFSLVLISLREMVSLLMDLHGFHRGAGAARVGGLLIPLFIHDHSVGLSLVELALCKGVAVSRLTHVLVSH